MMQDKIYNIIKYTPKYDDIITIIAIFQGFIHSRMRLKVYVAMVLII